MFRVAARVFTLLVTLLPPAIHAEPARTLDQTRFERALAELRTGMGPRYRQLRAELEDYPLAMYLDYEVLIPQLYSLSPAEARAFIASSENSPLANRFLGAYLERKGRSRRWRDFLGVLDAPPRSTRLQCFYYRALRDTGRKPEAWAGAAKLWNVGKSQDDACDPLFERWMLRTGGPDDDLVWSRALKAFDARNSHLIKYVKRFASPELEPLVAELYAVYRRPDKLVADPHTPSARHAELMTAGIRRLARVNPEQGRQALARALPIQPFTDEQVTAMTAMIARHSLFAQSSAPASWLADSLERLRDDELTEIYLRNQIAESRWTVFLEALPWLSEARRDEGEWRYWQARAFESLGRMEEAAAVMETLAGERSYHGFLAADRLGQGYQLNSVQDSLEAPPQDSGIDRVRELLDLERIEDARAEWRMLLGRHGASAKLALGQWALDLGLSHYAIDAANTAKAWDRLDLRFPSAFDTLFDRAAKAHGVPATELQAIARRESAMYTRARSRVGARGLMQVMPATAKQVARKAGISHSTHLLYLAQINIDIGSRYYRQLLDRFDNHRPRALAAYNAGPHRVDRWLEQDLPVDQWVDTLPFRETREYVRAVLAYTVIYAELSGQRGRLLTQPETLTQR